MEVKEEWIKDKILRIVDACFHAYASSHRVEAAKMAEEIWGEIRKEKDG